MTILRRSGAASKEPCFSLSTSVSSKNLQVPRFVVSSFQTTFIVASSQETCLTNEFGKFRPRRCEDFTFCAFCEKQAEVKPLIMKGFCPEMLKVHFDKEYYMDGLQNKRPFFRGVRNSFIYFQPVEADGRERKGNWIIQSDKSEAHKLILGSIDSQGYPFGRYPWIVGQNISVCGQYPGDSISLTLTSCPSETFTCQSGQS